jgi:hypothetical protein
MRDKPDYHALRKGFLRVMQNSRNDAISSNPAGPAT